MLLAVLSAALPSILSGATAAAPAVLSSVATGAISLRQYLVMGCILKGMQSRLDYNLIWEEDCTFLFILW